MPEWQPGPPISKGHYWVVQWCRGWFGPAVAFVYDGYPDDLQPPSVCTSGDPVYEKWKKDTEGIGVFLRVRLTEGFAAGDHELRNIPLTHHMPLALPALPLEPK